MQSNKADLIVLLLQKILFLKVLQAELQALQKRKLLKSYFLVQVLHLSLNKTEAIKHLAVFQEKYKEDSLKNYSSSFCLKSEDRDEALASSTPI